jgi:hypothetical protein
LVDLTVLREVGMHNAEEFGLGVHVAKMDQLTASDPCVR